jgi:hypothetical protein
MAQHDDEEGATMAEPVRVLSIDGVSDTVDYQMRQPLMCDDPHEHYYRFQTTLNAGNYDMDDASRTNIRVLKLLAEEIIRDHGKDLAALCEQLTEGTPAKVVEPEKSPLPPPPGIAGRPKR